MVDGVKRAPFIAMQQNHQQRQHKQHLHPDKSDRLYLMSPPPPQPPPTWSKKEKELHTIPPLAINIDESKQSASIFTTSPPSGNSKPNPTLHPKNDRRPSHTSSVQTGADSSPSSSTGMERAASVVADQTANQPKAPTNAFRSSSIFRMGRKSFGRKKANQEKIITPSPELATSFESQRSRISLGSLTGWSGKSSTSQSSSPVLYRDASSLPAPLRESMSSARTGESTSDGNRASSDLDSVGGNGKMAWGQNRSSISLLGDSIAEGVEAPLNRAYQSGGRLSLASSGVLEMGEGSPSISAKKKTTNIFEAKRPFSSPSVPQRSQSGDDARSAAQYSTSPSSPNSPSGSRKVSALVPVGSAGRAPLESLPPIPKITSGNMARKNHYESQRVSRQTPLTKTEQMNVQHRPDSATLIPFKVKKRSNVISMVDDELDPYPERQEQLDMHQFLQANGENSNRLEVPSTVKILRKTRSQSSFILSRRPSFLGGRQNEDNDQTEDKQQRVASFPQNGKTQDKARQKTRSVENVGDVGSGSASTGRISPLTSKAKRSPWDKMFASRMEIGDSSPELEVMQPFFTSSRKNRRISASSMDKQPIDSIYNVKASRNRKGSISANTSRPTSPIVGSRLDSSGGAATLFGTSSLKSRQRASSLLPSMPWRPQKASHADLLLSSSTNNSVTLSSSDPKSSLEKENQPATVKIEVREFNGNAQEFVQCVMAKVPKSDYSTVLASSGDELHRQALHIYMQQFYFAGNPLDIALRKLLMSVCLPKETQQIDRVMEAFARRYNECNEKLFSTDDQPYVLAFSLMMLHTDAFNKNAKQKMTKQDYLRNTASSGVRDEILEYLYDNLTFTQFIYVEDDETISRRKLENEPSNSGSFLSTFSSNNNSSSKNRIDPYYIIGTGQTHTLRAEIATLISEDSPFSAKGTAANYDVEALNRTFVDAPSIEIVTTKRPSFSSASALGSESLSTSFGAIEKEQETVVTLRITKVGCISRKDDIVDDNKKAQSRKWKTCGMILSSSQLLFFKDLVWTSALDQQIKEQTSQNSNQEGGVLITPRITYFRPDGVLALGDAIAMRDTSYKKYQWVIRLIARQGDQSRQYLIQTSNETEMNDWIHKINFCAAFRASSLRIRGLDPPNSPSLDNQNTAGFSSSSFNLGTVEGETLNDKTTSSSPSSPGLSFMSEGSINSSGVPMVGLMRRKLNARRKEVMPKLAIVSLKYRECFTELEEALRFARHLGILTPFMKVTRDRIEATAVPLANRIRQLRLDTAKYGSRREMLQLELDAGDRAARATASPSSFNDVPRDIEQERRPSAALSVLPSPMIDVSNNSFLHRSHPQRDADEDEDEGNLATPKVHTISIGEEPRSNVQIGFPPALIVRQYSSQLPPLLSSLHDEPSLDDFLGRVLEDPFVLNQKQPTSAASITSSSSSSTTTSLEANKVIATRSPPPRRFKHSTAPREEAERWDRSKVVKDSKRVSLVTLPDAEHLKNLARMSMNHASNLEERIE